ncbi:MAG: peptidoglycan-associated lipoprotein Pal [Rubrivivax sp.]|nr:peptidoglycan-associated lipoprotein Pal [Rubrivivax sp.]
MKTTPRSTWKLALPLVAAMVALAGCESTKLPEMSAVPVESRTPLAGTAGTAAATPSASTSGTPQSGVASVNLPGAAAGATAMMAAPSQRIVYFDFDSYAIKDEFKGLIDGHARALAANRGKRMVVEGHTDERGGREYNLALGQKRAEAVVRSLELLGVGGQQLEAVSFGEERPAMQGSDETAWARNRRAELKDR